MPDLTELARELAWPLAFTLAWVLGELANRWTGLPRISVYGLVGFALANSPLPLLPEGDETPLMLMAHLAFGLILFELGYRINLHWLRHNPWLGVTGLLQAGLVFAAVLAVALAFGQAPLNAVLLASLAISTSPAAVLRVTNELRSSGQVTERLLHLTALNCLLSVLAFKLCVGVWAFNSTGSLWQALSSSVLQLGGSVLLGLCFGTAVPALLRRLKSLARDATLGFALGVLLLVTLAQALGTSPLLAALTFGIVARHHRVVLAPAQRNFGALGELLCIALFVFVTTTVAWPRVVAGLGLALVLIAVRLLVQVAVGTLLARVSGISWRKGALTGLGMTPISVFVILLLEHTRVMGIDLLDQLAPLAAMTLLLDIAAPLVTRRALIWAGERGQPEHS